MWRNFPLFPPSASTLSSQVDALLFTALAIAALFSLLIAALIIAFAIKYRRRSAFETGQPIHPPMTVEATWTAVPLVITLGLFAWGARVYVHARRPPAGAEEYTVVAKQWMWKFQHPGGRREINELHVPVGRAIKLTMTSEDVIHSFFVPAFRSKCDVIPGRYEITWFQAIRPGTYHLFCAEYCGAEHSRMGGRVVVMEPYEYEQWLAAAAPGKAPAEVGAELFATLSCGTCHKAEDGERGPSLRGIRGRTVRLEGGATAVADEGYLREAILDPGARIVAGYRPLMPTYRGQVSEEQVLALIEYMDTRSAAGAGAEGR